MAQKTPETDSSFPKLNEYLEYFNNSTEEYFDRYQRETGMLAPKLDPFLTRVIHRRVYQNMCEDRNSNVTYSARTTVTHKVEPSFEPLDKLVRTRISQLRVNVPATGFYLIARTIEQPVHEVGLETIIEDHTGDVFLFGVYHMFHSDMAYKPEDILPRGTVFALKEPLLKTSARGAHLIRCENPTDIIFTDSSHRLLEEARNISWLNEIEETMTPCKPNTSEEWRKLGNGYFHKNQHYKALEAYFMALMQSETVSDETLPVLYSNIAAVYLKMGNFESVLLYSRKALDLSPNHVKAHYRSGRAHYELRQYVEASHHFKTVIKLDPNNKESSGELAKCVARLYEREGNVNIYKLFLTRIHKPRTEIDCADFTGPIEVVEIPKKGRGIVATEHISPGTLLCVSKALCVFFDNDSEGPIFEKDENGIFSSNINLVTKVAQSVMKNPTTFGRLLYDLPANKSGFGQKLFCDEKSRKEAIVDIDRIRNILDNNSFGITTADTKTHIGSALFHMPSYFNHSCVYNAEWEIYNDVFVVHAVKPIDRGEEIVITFLNNLYSFCERESRLLTRNFRCLCLLCELDRSEKREIREQREKLLKCVENIVIEQETINVSKLNPLISDVERTYEKSGRSKLKWDLFNWYLQRSSAFLKLGQLKKSKTDYHKALSAAGLSTSDLLWFVEKGKPLPKNCILSSTLCFAIEMIAMWFFKFGDVEKTQKWITVLLAFEKMCFGGDINVAKIKYQNLRFLLNANN